MLEKESAMLRKGSDFQGASLHAVDGEIGFVYDFYFDDIHWTVRYVVVDTGPWLFDRLVLISPVALEKPVLADGHLSVALTRQQVEDSPSVDAHRPVSRQLEGEVVRHFGWPTYWTAAPVEAPGPLDVEPESGTPFVQESGDPHLRSLAEVQKYRVRATDGDAGHIVDVIIDDEEWNIRHLVMDTGRWLPGRKVLISPDWTAGIDWAHSVVSMSHSRDEIRHRPPYDPSLPPDHA
jgi:hypothetical protein